MDQVDRWTHDLQRGRLSRRAFVTQALAAGISFSMIGAILEACSSGGGGSVDPSNGEAQDPSGAASSMKGDPNLTAELTFWGWYNVVPKAIVPDFQKLYPKVTFRFVDFSNPDTHTQLITTLNAGRGAPDLSMLQDRDAPRFWNLGLVDLTKAVSPYQADFPTYKWKKVLRPSGMIQAVPWESGPVAFAYRRDIFSRYGIDPTKINTYDDYIAAGKQLSAASGGKVKMLISNIAENPNGMQISLTADWAMLTQQNGGQYFSSDGRVTINSPQAVEALSMLKRFRDEGITLNDLASSQAEIDTMLKGTVATYFSPMWWTGYPKSLATSTSGAWSAFKLPAFKSGGARASNRGGTSLAITSQSKNAHAAWEFARFWLLTVQGRTLSETAGKIFEACFLPAAKDSFFNQPDDFFGGLKIFPFFSQVAQEAPSFPESPLLPEMETSFQSKLPDFLSGKKSAAQVVSEVHSEVQNQAG